MALYLVGLGLVSMPRSLPSCLAGSSVGLGWVPDPMSLPQGFLPMALSQPRALTLFSSHQVYFLCSTSACCPSGLKTYSTTCSSGAAGESRVGDKIGGFFVLSCLQACSWLLSHVGSRTAMSLRSPQ